MFASLHRTDRNIHHLKKLSMEMPQTVSCGPTEPQPNQFFRQVHSSSRAHQLSPAPHGYRKPMDNRMDTYRGQAGMSMFNVIGVLCTNMLFYFFPFDLLRRLTNQPTVSRQEYSQFNGSINNQVR